MISQKDVQKLAGLARIKLSVEEEEKFAGEIDSILGYVDQIKSASSADLLAGKKTAGRVKNALRDDDHPIESGIYSADILDNAPDREGDYVKVKKIL